MSLKRGTKLNKITDDGVEFASHLNGERLFMTPEKCIDIEKFFKQENINLLVEYSELRISISSKLLDSLFKKSGNWSLLNYI